MTLLPPYDIGTVTLVNGSADIVGNDTAWAVNGVTGGLMTVEAAGGNPLLLADVAADATATAATKWMGPSGTFKYAISLESAQAADVVWANRHWSRVVGQGLLAAIRPDASGTLAERDALNPMLDNGQWFARAEPPHDLEFYRKVPAGWEGPFTTRGVGGVGEGGLGIPSPGAANKMPYLIAPNTVGLTDLTPFARTLLDDTDAAAARATLGVLEMRERLIASRTYYVRATGSDANDGRTPGTAFLTLQAAYNHIARTIDISGYSVVIDVGPGVFEGLTLNIPFIGGNLSIRGAGASQTTITSAGVNTILVNVPLMGSLILDSFKLTGTGAATTGLRTNFACPISVNSTVDFGTCTDRHILILAPGTMLRVGSYTISGSATYHWDCQYLAYLLSSGSTITLTGTPNFSQAFIRAMLGSIAQITSNTFVGGATGRRYLVGQGGGIFVGGSGESYLPGNIAGLATPPGWYQ